MFLRRPPRRHRERSLGQSLVEFAIILPVFLVIMSAAIDLGRIAYARVTIANVAREASFQAAQTPTSYLAGQPCDQNTNMVICRAILESKGSVITVNPADITLTCAPSCSTAPAMGNTVTVKATGHFNLLTPVMAVFFGGTSVTFSSTATNQVGALPVVATTTTTGTTSTSTSTTSTSTTTATTTSSTSTAPSCSAVSAAFTYTVSDANGSSSLNKSPVSVTVTDHTTYNPLCVTVWAWSWGDGTTTYGQVQAPHTLINPGPADQTFILSLTVTSGTFTSTVGGYAIVVKKG
jgi:Flp pilus assembly protein TadG